MKYKHINKSKLRWVWRKHSQTDCIHYDLFYNRKKVGEAWNYAYHFLGKLYYQHHYLNKNLGESKRKLLSRLEGLLKKNPDWPNY